MARSQVQKTSINLSVTVCSLVDQSIPEQLAARLTLLMFAAKTMYADEYIGIAEELTSHCIRGPWFFQLLCLLRQMLAMNAKDRKLLGLDPPEAYCI